MVYNPATDFLALWRNIAGNVSKLEMPGLDYVVQALARAGLINLTVSATAPVANQPTTAWLQAAVPSYSGEGTLHLWDPVAGAYALATPGLFLAFLQAAGSESGISWWTVSGGPPANTIGINGDLAIRTDEPGGIYGPKALGAWPLTPIPGTADTVSSSSLDNTFGVAQGNLLYRDLTLWKALPIGAPDTVLASIGNVPTWENLSALFDLFFGSAQGSILYRDTALWNDLGPGAAGQVLSTNGPGANPAWVAKTPEFASGTVMVFQQSAAPIGWTKQTALNDYGLRVVSGAAGATPGTDFSTVFAQTVVGNTTLTEAQIPPHTHGFSAVIAGGGALAGGSAPSVAPNSNTASTTDNGASGGLGGAPHTHSISLSLAYVDVIIASKN